MKEDSAYDDGPCSWTNSRSPMSSLEISPLDLGECCSKSLLPIRSATRQGLLHASGHLSLYTRHTRLVLVFFSSPFQFLSVTMDIELLVLGFKYTLGGM